MILMTVVLTVGAIEIVVMMIIMLLILVSSEIIHNLHHFADSLRHWARFAKVDVFWFWTQDACAASR